VSGKLRIIHCFRSPVGGIFRHVRDLVRAQAAAGHEVGIICDSSTGGDLEARYFAEIDHLLALGVKKLPIQRSIGPRDIATLWRTYSMISNMKPDVLHGHGAKGGAIARLFGTLLRMRGRKVARLYSPHGGVLHYAPDTTKGRVLFRLERLLGRMGDHLLFVSDHERRAFLAKIGIPHSTSSLVYNGLQPAEFEPVELEADASDLLYVGMMRDLKGPDLFIEALTSAEGELGRTLTATMIGDGDDLPSYRKQAKDAGLGDRVRFVAPMPARQAFAKGNVIVVPSRAEAMPYIVLEALAAGKSMIATRVGGIPEIFGSANPALVEPDAVQLSAKMVEALRDPQRFALHMPALADLKARFGADVMAAGVEKAYLACLEAQPIKTERST
jgi:glycosyltransferase involved in cell wall biosynthesis